MSHVEHDALAQRILAATRRAEELARRRAAVEARLDDARKAYKKIAAEAKEKYGTDDPEALQQEIERREKENIARLTAFESALSTVDAAITEAERALSE